MQSISIIPLNVGSSRSDHSMATLRKKLGVVRDNRFCAYYIEGAEKRILVDTGPSDQEHALKWHKEINPAISPDQNIVVALDRIGVKAEEIEIVLLTHLHYDHAFNLKEFKNAEIYVAREELSYALMPLPPHYFSYENWKIGLTPYFISSIERMKILELEPQEVFKKITMIPTPGHSLGHMSVVVETSQGPYVICGDAAIIRENLVGDPARHVPYTMVGLYMDFVATWKSLETIDKIVGGDVSRVLPGHDPSVFEKERYPDI